MYGMIQQFIRVLCRVKQEVTELVIVKWFATPTYPDGDPLLVRIDRSVPPPPDCETFLFLDEIDPTPVLYELVEQTPIMFMMRLRGLDVSPDF